MSIRSKLTGLISAGIILASPLASGSQEQGVDEVLNTWERAFQSRNTELLESVLSDDFIRQYHFGERAAPLPVGKDKYLGDISEAFSLFSDEGYGFNLGENYKVKPIGENEWAVYGLDYNWNYGFDKSDGSHIDVDGSKHGTWMVIKKVDDRYLVDRFIDSLN